MHLIGKMLESSFCNGINFVINKQSSSKIPCIKYNNFQHGKFHLKWSKHVKIHIISMTP